MTKPFVVIYNNCTPYHFHSISNSIPVSTSTVNLTLSARGSTLDSFDSDV